MGAAHSAPRARAADLAVLVEFEDMGDADRFMSAGGLSRDAAAVGLRDVSRDGDIVRMRIHLHDDLSAGHLRAVKRAILGHSSGRAFVRDARGRYRPWHSRQLCASLSRAAVAGKNGVKTSATSR